VVAIIRSSDLRLGPAAAGHALRGVLEESLFLGSHYRHYVRVGDALVMVDGPVPEKPGLVTVTIPPDRLRVYPPSSG